MTKLETAYQLVSLLVKDFKENESKFLSPFYSEADVRKDFIDKFFNALGWDVYHNEQKNPYEQEVKIEKGVYVGKQQKRADYAFHLAPNFRDIKFYVEAKKPSRNLTNADDYFQSIRYGWNAGTPITFLTDFEEIHILDCRIKPDISSILNYRIKKYHYSDFLNEDHFSEIYWLLSREAVVDNSLEKFADALPKPKGKAIQKGTHRKIYQSIDEAFLEELDEIRDSLAKAFKKANPHLESEPLTEMTQRMIDRLVFIRFLEDKQIEPDHYVSEFANSKSAWKDFKISSRKLDAKYNGIVFKKHAIDSDNFIPPDDKIFSSICEELAHVNSPYNFDIIPIHILGSIYERFLGKVVIATDKRVRIEEKPEVRKAGGVYYTPQYIVNYIVDNTVGKLIEGKSPKEIAGLRFADISCGSGSFLITVFDRLLEHHRKWYQDNPEQAKKDGCYYQDGKWILSLKQKQKILTNNIYGVDLDSQAVEVTQLSLYLKLLEDETTATAQDTWVMFKEQLLPNLNSNIVCGNSLIGTDILESSLFDRDEEMKLKPMNFEDAFPEVMRKGGFDAIVGNPPYIKIQTLQEFQSVSIDYFKNKYVAAKSGNFDIYVMFIEKAYSLINKNGLLGYIQPHKFFQAEFGDGIRNLLAANQALHKVIHFSANQIFKNATTYTCLLFLRKSRKENFAFIRISDNADTQTIISTNFENKFKDYFESSIIPQPILNAKWNFTSPIKTEILNKMLKGSKTLEEITRKIFVGLQTSADDIYVLKILKEEKDFYKCFSTSLKKEVHIEKGIVKPFLMGKDVKRYEQPKQKNVVVFPYEIKNNAAVLMNQDLIEQNFPKGWEYLLENRKELANREKGKMKGEKFYAYIYPKNLADFEFIKIMTPYFGDKTQMTIDFEGYLYHTTKVYSFIFNNNIKEHINYFLGILNSKLLWFYLKNSSTVFRGGWIVFATEFLKPFPIRLRNNSTDQDIHDKLVQLVDQMLESKKQLANAKTESEKEYLEKKCMAIDRQIDQLVYELYGLTEEEIKIVEGNG